MSRPEPGRFGDDQANRQPSRLPLSDIESLRARRADVRCAQTHDGAAALGEERSGYEGVAGGDGVGTGIRPASAATGPVGTNTCDSELHGTRIVGIRPALDETWYSPKMTWMPSGVRAQ